jgi:hypothetical protein
MAVVNLSASYVGLKVLEGATAADVEAAADAWLDANIATEVVAIEPMTVATGFALLVIFRRERRVRHQ